MAAKPDAAKGQQVYFAYCADCHGSRGQGDASAATPVLAGQVTSYLVKQLVDVAEGDRELSEMHRIVARSELSTPQALRDVATHLSTLPLIAPQTGDGKQLVLGQRIYHSACAQCHGQEAQGDGTHLVPALRGQHYSYLLMQARRLAVGHRYSVDPSVIQLLEALTFDQLTAVADFASRLPLKQQPVVR
ncbi:MAG: c-type cytochrome [Steroidobacteraceae bacterium]